MELEVLADAEAVAQRAAAWLAAEARAAAAERRSFTLALSGGSTPWKMCRALAEEDVPWPQVELFQVDERVAPVGDSERNWTHLSETLLARVPELAGRAHAMPVDEPDLDAAARYYASLLARRAGVPPTLDAIHLGLGADGHTASLVPGDPVLEVADADVALTAGVYQGRRRMTLTYPLLDRARRVLWVVTGTPKREMLRRLRAGDGSIPAGRVCPDRALVLADREAAEEGKEADPVRPTRSEAKPSGGPTS